MELAEAARRREESSETYRTTSEDGDWLEEEEDRFKPVERTDWQSEYGLEPFTGASQEEPVVRREHEAVGEPQPSPEVGSRAWREQSLLAASRLQRELDAASQLLESEGDITREEEAVFPAEIGEEIGEIREIRDEQSLRQSLFHSLQDAHSARKAFLLSEVFGPAMGVRKQMGPRDPLWDR